MKKGVMLLIAAGMITACKSPQKKTAETFVLVIAETSAAKAEESTGASEAESQSQWKNSAVKGESGEGGAWLDVVQPEDDDFILPDSDKRGYSREELWDLDKATLRLARNEIYARHGCIFEEKDLQEYFRAKSWYYGCIPAEEFDENLYLNEDEKDNAYMLWLMEEEIGPFYGTYNSEYNIAWLGVYISDDEQMISVTDINKNGVELTFSGYTEEGVYIYTAVFPYVGDDKNQIVNDANAPVQQTVFTLQEDGILVEVLPDGGWAANFYARQ